MEIYMRLTNMYDVIKMLTLQHISKHWTDIYNLYYFTQAKKVTMSKDSVGSAVPVISVNYSKLIKGFKKLKMGEEDFGR